MKILTAIVAVVVLLLIGGAAFRVVTMTPETAPLIDLGLARPDADEPAPRRSSRAAGSDATAEQGKFGEVGTGAKVAGHLKGNAWEKEESAPAASDKTEEQEAQEADKAVDDREGDLQDAKGRIKGIL